MGRYTERYFPLVASLATVGTAYVYLGNLTPTEANKIFALFIGAGLSVSTTLLGFLLTTYSLFQTISTRRKDFIIQLGQLPVLNRYLRVAVYSLLLSSIVLLTLTLVSVSAVSEQSWRIVQLCTIFIASFALACSARFVNIFLQLAVD